jgi:hypothetical protein
MSETLWKREAEQIVSAGTLLTEYEDDIDILTFQPWTELNRSRG